MNFIHKDLYVVSSIDGLEVGYFDPKEDIMWELLNGNLIPFHF